MSESRVEQTKRHKVTLNIICLTDTPGYNKLILLAVDKRQVIPAVPE